MEETYENYTPHPITVFTEGGQIDFPSRGQCRVTEEQQLVGHHREIQLRTTTYGSIDGLPAPKEGVRYIVSLLVTQANKRMSVPRQDLVSPDTGKTCIRDEKGQIKGVTGFII
jgi:hypothetical protein